MKSYTQKTYRVEAKKAELIDSIRKERGLSWNAIVDAAFDMLLNKAHTALCEPIYGKVQHDVPSIPKTDSIPPVEMTVTDTATEETPNKDITAPEYDKVTEGYNPDDKTTGGQHGGGFNLSVGDEDEVIKIPNKRKETSENEEK